MLHVFATWRLDRIFAAESTRTEGRARGAEARAAGTMRAHLARCERCRRRYERHLLAEAALPGGERRAADRLWQEITAVASAGAGAPAARPWRWPVGLGAFGLAAGLLVLAMDPRGLRGWAGLGGRAGSGADEGFAARGEATELAIAPALHVFHADAAGSPRPVAGVVGASEGLLFAYSNPASSFTHLMVFALDANRRVYWFYPAYERVGDDPLAVPIETQKGGVELGEEIRHPLSAGPLRLFALFLPRAERVLNIEAAVARAYGAGVSAGSVAGVPDLPLAVPGAHQASFLLEVTP